MADSKQEKILSRKLLGKVVVSKGGKRFGEVGDLIFDTKSGEIIDFTIQNPTKYVQDVSVERDSNGDYLVPFHSVIAIGDFVVIAEEDIL
ncbi:MAG: PRC-barrel domain-containing protein [Nanoarchaeota archaeon]|nr:PRC-barrel domain-containing protein [Nanoarchaeota archaeon]